MIGPRYIVFDDAPHDPRFAGTADQFADAIRAPLAAIGVRVVRQNGTRSNSSMAGFQARGWSRSRYSAKLNDVGQVVNGITTQLIAADSDLKSDRANTFSNPPEKGR